MQSFHNVLVFMSNNQPSPLPSPPTRLLFTFALASYLVFFEHFSGEFLQRPSQCVAISKPILQSDSTDSVTIRYSQELRICRRGLFATASSDMIPAARSVHQPNVGFQGSLCKSEKFGDAKTILVFMNWLVACQNNLLHVILSRGRAQPHILLSEEMSL